MKAFLDVIPRFEVRVNPFAMYGIPVAMIIACFVILQSAYNTTRDDAKTAKVLTDKVSSLTAQVAAIQQASCDNVRFVYRTQIADLTRRAGIEQRAHLDGLSVRRTNSLLYSANVYRQNLKHVCNPTRQQVQQAVKATQVAPPIAATALPTMPIDPETGEPK